MPVGITLLLEYTAVLMVALFAFFVFREKVKARLWIAIALVLAGLAVVAQVWDSNLDPLGVLFAAVAAVTLAFYFLVGERQVGATSPLTVAFWTMTFATAFWAFFSGWWELRPETFTRAGAGGRSGRRPAAAAAAPADRHGRRSGRSRRSCCRSTRSST